MYDYLGELERERRRAPYRQWVGRFLALFYLLGMPLLGAEWLGRGLAGTALTVASALVVGLFLAAFVASIGYHLVD